MSIIDIEEELGIKIPQGPNTTPSGLHFPTRRLHPTKGWKIHHDDFDLEVLSSTERAIEKIRITPTSAINLPLPRNGFLRQNGPLDPFRN